MDKWKHIKIKPDLHKVIKGHALELEVSMEALVDHYLREMFYSASLPLDAKCEKCGQDINSWYRYCEECAKIGGSNG